MGFHGVAFRVGSARVHLRGIDAEEADALLAAVGQAHVERIAVDHRDHDGSERRPYRRIALRQRRGIERRSIEGLDPVGRIAAGSGIGGIGLSGDGPAGGKRQQQQQGGGRAANGRRAPGSEQAALAERRSWRRPEPHIPPPSAPISPSQARSNITFPVNTAVGSLPPPGRRLTPVQDSRRASLRRRPGQTSGNRTHSSCRRSCDEQPWRLSCDRLETILRRAQLQGGVPGRPGFRRDACGRSAGAAFCRDHATPECLRAIHQPRRLAGGGRARALLTRRRASLRRRRTTRATHRGGACGGSHGW